MTTERQSSSAEEETPRNWAPSDIVDDCLSLSSRALIAVDLTYAPRSLRAVSLAANRLTHLDLIPLAACTQLESLVLNGNALESIDLAPLATCTRLEKLWLHHNSLRALDLRPLAQCVKLRSLYLEGNKIDSETIDLTPLEDCRHLRSLRLGRNQLAGELDITPILSCASLSSLDVSASVRLVARLTSSTLCAQTASASLPPALRRKAATVVWMPALDDDNQSEESLCESSDELEDADITQCDPLAPLCSSSEGNGVCLCEGVCSKNMQTKSGQTRQPSPLDELRLYPYSSKTSGVYTALMLGFQGNTQYSVVSLLEKHGSLKTINVPTQSAEVSPTSLVSIGALKKCHVILLRPQAESMILGLRTFDSSVPIIVVGSSDNASEGVKRCMHKGATTFLQEPLSTRDALTIRIHAQKRARSMCSSSKNRNSKTSSEERRMKADTYRVTLDVDAIDSGIPTSPLTSSESSPPSGVPTVPFELSMHQAITAKVADAQSTQVRLKNFDGSLEPMSKPKKELPFIRKLIKQKNERSHSVRARIESSGLNMVFSRSGGYSSRENFRSIATICGLPVCVGPVLFDATKIWLAKMETSGMLREPQPRKQFTLSKVGSAPALSRGVSGAGAARLSALRRRNSAPPDLGNIVTYEQFVQFWESNLRQHDCERRLFIITSIANQFARAVPLAAVSQFASNFMMRRSSSVEEFSLCGDTDAREACAANLAARVVGYELHGGLRSRLSQGELVRANLCSSLLAAESGIYNGVTAHLRTDRLRGIRSAFADACGARDVEPCAYDVAMFNAERGLLTPRAVDALFARYVPAKTMSVLEFAPMWLATHDLTSSAASSYLFGVLDVNQDGYICAADVAHFYTEKCAFLARDGFVPVRFEHIWHSILDNLGHGRSVSLHGRKQLSLAEMQKVSERDRVTFWQSVLFIEDELASVDWYRTAAIGGTAAALAVRATF